MKKKQILVISLAILLLGGIGVTAFHTFVSAQSAGQGLEVLPPSQEVTIDPGKTTVIKAKLRNSGNSTLPIQVRVEDFTAKGDEGQVALSSDSPYSIVSWTKASPKQFSLAPGEEQEVTGTITAPKDAAGGHFGSFVFSTAASNNGQNTTAVSQEIASLFLVRVNGPVNEKLDFKSLTAPSYSEFGPIPFSLTFQNSGNVYTKTFGLINVQDMFGKKVADIVVPGTNVFPGAERVIKANLDKRFLFGNYTATALMYYGAQNQSLSATTTFFVFPTRIALVVFVILFILFLLRKRLGKALKALFGK